MSDGFIGKRVFLPMDGPFLAAGLLLTHLSQTCDHNILTRDQLKLTYLPCMGMPCD